MSESNEPSKGIPTSLLVEFFNELVGEVNARKDQIRHVAEILGIPRDEHGGLAPTDAVSDMERFNFSLGILSGQREFLNSLMAFLITWSNDSVGKLKVPPKA